jgi:hypothetical protein
VVFLLALSIHEKTKQLVIDYFSAPPLPAPGIDNAELLVKAIVLVRTTQHQLPFQRTCYQLCGFKRATGGRKVI